MCSRRKKLHGVPRSKRMNKSARLQSARHWIKAYNGKNIVHGYRNYFGVDLLCAAIELQLIGVCIATEYIVQLRKTLETKTLRRQKLKREQALCQTPAWQDENFFYIAGYTSNGFAYGVTYEEAEAIF